MTKITKQQLKRHEQAEELLWSSDKKLTRDQVAFCLENWDPRAASGKHVAKNQAYFTPMTLASDACLYVGGDGRRVVDIGAGIGRLTYAVLKANYFDPKQVAVTAVEFNPEYVKIGKRLIPEADWIEADFYDLTLWQSLPRFDEAVSNPPFGRVFTTCDTSWIGYRGPAGLTTAAISLKIARLGAALILPQTQTPYRFSGRRSGENPYHASQMSYLKKFLAQRPTLEWSHSSIDTEQEAYKSGWRGAAPIVELTSIYESAQALIPLNHAPVEPPPAPKPVYALP